MKPQTRPTTSLSRLRDSLMVRIQRVLERSEIPQDREQLLEIVDQHSHTEHLMVFPPGLGWKTHLFQRPQQLARQLARRGVLVFYMEPELSREVQGFHPLEDNLCLCRVPTQTFTVLERPLAYSLTWNRKYLSSLTEPRIIYDFVDDLAAFGGPRARLTRDHHWLAETAELVIATSQPLLEQVRPQRPDAILVPNGVEYEHFYQMHTRAERPPHEMAPIVFGGRPVIGYHGALARWFDYELMRDVAGKRPDYAFLLIGPDYDGSLTHSGLLTLPNVYWIGSIDYERLPSYLAYVDVAAIPFQRGAIARATSPLKLFEYMAGGVPIVITRMQESMRYPGVLPAQGADEFASRLDEALALRKDSDYLAVLDKTARENTWEKRAGSILDAINK
ncbi:MAG: glycosyltransferase [Anaerolineales bacterium]|nr:glycosyltransferase [Anaerolineales bacterium]